MREVITGPLGMRDTPFTPSPEAAAAVHAAGCEPGRAIRCRRSTSTCSRGRADSARRRGDMLTWAEANLHPEAACAAGRDAGAALRPSHEPRATLEARSDAWALAWFIDPEDGPVLPRRRDPRRLGVRLVQSARGLRRSSCSSNTGPGSAFSADFVAEHIRARLAGPRRSRWPRWRFRPRAACRALLRFAASWWLTMIAAGAFIFGLVMACRASRSSSCRAACSCAHRRFCSSARSRSSSACIACSRARGAEGADRRAAAVVAMTCWPWSPSFWFLGLVPAAQWIAGVRDAGDGARGSRSASSLC